MNRKLYLECIKLECIKDRWYAVEHFERFEGGEIRIARRRHALGVVGKDKRKAAERALRSLEVEVAMVRRDEVVNEEISVLEYSERFLAAAALDVRSSTLRSYKLWIRRFVLKYGQLQLGAIRPAMIEAWKIELAEKLSPSTVNVALRSLRVMFGKAARQGVIARNPFDHVSFVDVPRRSFPPYWTPDQFTEFMEVVTAPRQRVANALAFFAGLRVRETVTLRWKDIKDDTIEIVSRADARTKGDRSRRVPLFAPLRAHLDSLPHFGDYVLSSASTSRRRTQPLSAVPRASPTAPPPSRNHLPRTPSLLRLEPRTRRRPDRGAAEIAGAPGHSDDNDLHPYRARRRGGRCTAHGPLRMTG